MIRPVGLSETLDVADRIPKGSMVPDRVIFWEKNRRSDIAALQLVDEMFAQVLRGERIEDLIEELFKPRATVVTARAEQLLGAILPIQQEIMQRVEFILRENANEDDFVREYSTDKDRRAARLAKRSSEAFKSEDGARLLEMETRVLEAVHKILAAVKFRNNMELIDAIERLNFKSEDLEEYERRLKNYNKGKLEDF